MTREEVDRMSLAVVAAALVIGPLIVMALGPWFEMRAYNRYAQEPKATYWQAVTGYCDHEVVAVGSVKERVVAVGSVKERAGAAESVKDWAAVKWER
jgi:hypothetical protein